MSGISLQCVKQAGAFLFTTALSCGPSQLFGCIKLIVDTCLILVNKSRKIKLNSNIKKIDNDWDGFKTSSTASLVAKKLGLEINTLDRQVLVNYFNTKILKTNNKIKKLTRSIRADAFALIPLMGAHFSWRIATDYVGKNFTPIFSRGILQLLEHSKSMASRPLFWGRKSKSTNKSIHHGEYIEISTSTKNRKIQIYHQLARKLNNIKTPTVVLFHPNMGGAKYMDYSARFYRQKGYNTLAVVLGGYKGSPGVTTSEKSMYQDIEGVKRFLADKGVTKVAYHGFSLGCGAALQAASGESLVSDLKTLFVVLDQPYTSAAAIGDNVAGHLGKGVFKAGCPKGLNVELPGGLWTTTDGLNNLKKVAKLSEDNIPLMCFETDKDFFMGRKKQNGKYTKNFAQDLLNARYGDSPIRTKNLVTLSGPHGFNSLRRTSLWDSNFIPSIQDTQ